MSKILVPFLFVIVFLFNSCKSQSNKILGYWEATFSDPGTNPVQYLEFKKTNNILQLVSDEPVEDWYDIPCENVSFYEDSLFFERFWGLEAYSGKFLPGDSVVKGVKLIKSNLSVPFTLRRIMKKDLRYKIPRIDQQGKKVQKYQYTKPLQGKDDISSSSLGETGIDSLLIFELMNRILSGEIPNIHSLLILKDNQLVLEEYFHNYSSERLHRIHSATKSFTSALTGIALDKHLIPDVNVPVWEYFLDWNDSPWINEKYDIQLKHLLGMSAGLDWKGLTINETNDDMEMYKTDDYFNYLLNKKLIYEPGTAFCYNNGLSLMVGHILEKASGMSVSAFAKEFLFDEIGVKNYSFDIDKNSITRTDGGLKMRPRDMMKFGVLYLNNGEWNGKQLISPDWIAASTAQIFNVGYQDYGWHWWIKNYSIHNKLYRSYYAMGHGEQAIIIFPDLSMIVVFTAGNYLEPEHRPFEIIEQYILPSLSPDELLIPAYTTDELKKFEGAYHINTDENIQIVIRDSSLFAIDPSGAEFRLIPASPNYFIVENMMRDVYFVSEQYGTITSAEIFIDGQRVDILRKEDK